MIAIIRNTNSLSIDVTETGGTESKIKEGKTAFGSLFSDFDITSQKEFIYKEELMNREDIEYNIPEILDGIYSFGIKVPEETLDDFKEQLVLLFKNVSLTIDTVESGYEVKKAGNHSKLLNNLLKGIEGFLNKAVLERNDKALILDKVKGYITNKFLNIGSEKDRMSVNESKSLREIAPLSSSDQKKQVVDDTKEYFFVSKKDFPTNHRKEVHQLRKSLSDGASKKIKLSEDNPANKFFKNGDSTTSLDQNKVSVTQTVDVPKDIGVKQQINVKETLNVESLGKIHEINYQKTETSNNSGNQGNSQPNSSFKPDSNRILENLNMLSKDWGNKLINRIEQSIINGDEGLTISLTPKNLGKLNITINMQDSLTKINIVAESASAAALLGEAENKLSQMMETSGLKLLTFQTSSQQFGGNQGKNMKHQKETKHHDEKESKSDELNLVLSKKNEISTKDGLNLIA